MVSPDQLPITARILQAHQRLQDVLTAPLPHANSPESTQPSTNGSLEIAEEDMPNGQPGSRRPKQLSVAQKPNCQGKLVYMAARPNHFSQGPEAPRWQIMLPEDIRALESELRSALKPRYWRGRAGEAQDCLRVAMVGSNNPLLMSKQLA